ncbi:MAG: hypothetical protein Q7S39_03940 [Ignavibacteria bacterium]|nr:hypothetical protein [Ignavibacteria bacterium]
MVEGKKYFAGNLTDSGDKKKDSLFSKEGQDFSEDKIREICVGAACTNLRIM